MNGNDIKSFINNAKKTDENVCHRILNEIINSQEETVLIVDKEYKIITANKRFLNTIKKSLDEIIGKSALDYLPKNEIMDKRTKKFQDFLKEKNTFRFIDERNGVWFDNLVQRVLDDKGDVDIVILFARDITKQKIIEKELFKINEELSEQTKKFKDLSEKYEFIAEYTADVVFQIDLKGKIIYMNKSVVKNYGYSKDEMIGKNFRNFVPKKEMPKYINQIKRMVLGEKIFNFESYVIHKNGKMLPAEFSGQLVKINNRRYINGTLRDISERKRTEEALKESEVKYKLIMDNINDGVYTLDKDGFFTFVNNIILDRSGIPEKKWYKLRFTDIVTSEYVEKTEKNFKKVLNGHKVKPYEVAYKNSYGNILFVEINTVALYNEENKIIGIQGIARDVSYRKKTEEILQKAHDELEKRVKLRTKELELAHNEVRIVKDRLSSIIDSASEIIISVDKNKKLAIWNKKAENVTGFRAKRIIGKNINKLDIFENPKIISDLIDNFDINKSKNSEKLVVKTKNSKKRILKISISAVFDIDNNFNGVLCIGHDITFDLELHGNLLFSNGYIISGKDKKRPIETFLNLTTDNVKGLLITRGSPESIKSNIPLKNIEVKVLKHTTSRDFEHIADLDSLIGKIHDFINKNKKSVIMLDRVDYLIAQYGFEDFIKSIYQINNIVSSSNSIFLLYIDSDIIDNKGLAYLENELMIMPNQKIENVQIKGDYFEILDIINQKNLFNTIITYKDISKEMSLNIKTVSTRIKELEEKGLVYVKKQGRSKSVYITEAARTILNKRKIL